MRRTPLVGLLALALPACGALIGIKDLTDAVDTSDAAEREGGALGDASTDSGDRDRQDGDVIDGGTEATTGCGDVTQNPDHCGRCDHSCLGGQCVASVCQPFALAPGQGQVAGVALSATHVYFTSMSGKTVSRVALDGGSVDTLAGAPHVAFPTRVAVNATHVYWNNADLFAGKISRCLITGCVGAPEVLAQPEEPTGLGLDATHVYWVDRNGGKIGRRPLDGGAEQLVADTSSTGALPVSLALGAPYVFWVEDFSGGVFRNEPSDGGLVSVGAGGLLGREIVTSDQFVYWGAGENVGATGRISRAPRSGGPIATVGAANGEPKGMAVDQTRVYWSAWRTASDGGAPTSGVYACPIVGCAGAAPEVVASAQREPRGVAVDATALYWGVDGALMKLAKP